MDLRLLTYSLIFTCPLRISATPSSFGQEFMVAVPQLTHSKQTESSSIIFVMYTLSDKSPKVIITCPWFKDQPKLNELIVLEHAQPAEFILPNIYRSPVANGRKGTYRLISDYLFGVYVMITVYNKSIDSFLALPLEAWSTKYMAYTLSGNPSIQVISAWDDNSIVATLRLAGSNFKIMVEGKIYGNGDHLKFFLNRAEGFDISRCGGREHVSMTGTHIVGHKEIGVISGNCEAMSSTYLCNHVENKVLSLTTDFSATMMMPLDMGGKEFVLIDVPIRVLRGYYYITVTLEAQVTIWSGENVQEIYVKYNALVDSPPCCALLKSDKTIQIVYIQNPACLGSTSDGRFVIREPYGDTSVSLLVPSQLFHVMYIWRVPTTGDQHWNYAALVVHGTRIRNLLLDREKLRDKQVWIQVSGETEYKVTHLQVSDGDHILTSNANIGFGCYIYALALEMMFMRPAGIQRCNYQPVAGDLLDNDCDGIIDEEFDDDMDNDNDTKVDEDLRGEFKAGYILYLIAFHILTLSVGVLLVYIMSRQKAKREFDAKKLSSSIKEGNSIQGRGDLEVKF